MNLLRAISEELTLREPQEHSLVKLDALLSGIKLGKESTREIEAKLPGTLKFDTEFPSFTFALATGIGKTRLMAAHIAYLAAKKKYRNYFILTPSETIYTKTIQNFTPGDDKYVFQGLLDLPDINLITGENYEYSDFGDRLADTTRINIYVFNIQKIFNKRKDVEFKFHKFKETLGSSFAEMLRNQNDLVVLMDESHRYRGEASLRAIHNLDPVLGLEYTATPGYPGNVVYAYSLGDAIKDAQRALEWLKTGGDPYKGYIKIPYILATKDDFSYRGDADMYKLQDGIARHRAKKVLLKEYCANNGLRPFQPVTLITTKSIEHSQDVYRQVTDDSFFGGFYKNRTLLVHSKSEDETLQELLGVDTPQNKNEIVIHVDKLKEGWDVKNVFTIVPFRSSISRTLIEQTIGRGLRLPFGTLVGVDELDSLEIVSHDNYKRVLAAAHEVASQIEVKIVSGNRREELAIHEIKPVNKSKAIDVPAIETTAETSFNLKNFTITMSLDELKKITPALIRANILTKEAESVEKVQRALDTSPVNYLVRLVIKENPELDLSQKPVLQKLIKSYLGQLKVEKDDVDLMVAEYAQVMLDDINTQVRAHFSEQTRIKYKFLKGFSDYKPWQKSIPADRELIPFNESDEVKGNIFTGYQNSVYEAYSFDSTQEKYLADLLDRDKNVAAWVKLPINQLPLAFKYGNYNPDFIVDTEDTNYLVEVKSRKELGTAVVRAKAAEAKKWTAEASELTMKQWVYKLLPHDVIDPKNSFDAVISNAVATA